MAAGALKPRRLAACAALLGCAVAAHSSGAQEPPTAPAPVVQSFDVEPQQPAVGQAVTVTMRVRDPLRPIRGFELDLGEPAGRNGLTACQSGRPARGSPFAAGSDVTFRMTVRYRTAGVHTLRFKALTGACSGTRGEVEAEVIVTVRPATPLPVIGRAAQALCSHADTRITPSNTADIRSATLCLVNGERSRRSRAFLRANSRLARAAARHTQDMVRRRFFDHEGPSGPTFAERIQRVRYRGRAGENIGYEAGDAVTPRSIVRAWMESAPHKANILSKRFRSAGVGVSARVPVNPEEPGSTVTTAFGATR